MFAKAFITRLFIPVALLTMVICAAAVQPALSKSQLVDSQEAPKMLQFTSCGHVLGFKENCMYVATGSHMLRESFVGTDGVTPRADRSQAADSGSQPLGKVRYPELWPGITLVYDSPRGGIVRSNYQVEPGADPKQIGMRYNIPVRLDSTGNLVFGFETGTMTACSPVAWQEIGGQRVPVDVAFQLDDSKSTVYFSLGFYNPELPLFIDPTLTWNTFMGSADEDSGYAIAVDNSGNIYVTGTSDAAWGSPVNAHSGWRDALVAKLNTDGELQWHTFMGSSINQDRGCSIAVDDNGNVYIVGRSNASWGTPVNAYAGDWDAFAAKLNGSGELQWNTFMGSTNYDYGHAIAVDGSGNVYAAGRSDAAWGSPVNGFAGGSDGFAAKLNGSGQLQWNTFMGSSYGDIGVAMGIAVDEGGNVFVTGDSTETWGSPVNAHAGSNEAFVAKLNSSGELQWNTFMGSSSGDDAYAVAIDDSGNLYVAGESYASWGSPVNAHVGLEDAFVAKLNGSGELQWNTFMGSSGRDYGEAIAVNNIGYINVAGYSNATWGNPVYAYAGGYEVFAAGLNGNGELEWNTFLGSSGSDYNGAVAADGVGNLYVAGTSEATWGSPVNAHAGGGDAFAAMLSKGALTAPGIPLLLLDTSTE